MIKIAKQLAYKTLNKYKLYNTRDYNDIASVIEKHGFILIPFKKYGNTQDVAECIAKLHLEESIQNKDAFIYLNDNLKLVFVNSALSDEDKYLLLCHELGHILDPSLQNSNFSYFKIQNEEFANEFSYHLKNPSLWNRLNSSMVFKIVLLAVFVLCVLFVGSIGTSHISSNLSVPTSIDYVEKCYVTANGQKYHRNFCVVVKDLQNLKEYEAFDDAESEGYAPCLLCIGEEQDIKEAD